MMMAQQKYKIAVILGGISAEREVSLRSGAAVVKALTNLGHAVTAVDGVAQLLALNCEKFDVVFNILHGEAGENGELAGLLSSLGMKYTGCDANGAVLSWNKDIAKTLIHEAGMQTPQAQTLNDSAQLQLRQADSGPWIVKPTKEGSSVGLYYATSHDELKTVVKKALTEVDSILVESFIQGSECTVAIVAGVVLPVVRIKPAVALYDYQAKYQSQQTQYFCPSGYDADLEQAIKQDALKIYEILKLKGWARIDFIIDEQNKRWFLEANTTPGMTETSLVPKAAAAIGWSFDDLVGKILSTAFEDENHV
ncbi:MAG TPA: D-alanine--D-alanine ligase [Oceanospirillales bacterium]|nr:D-alanine--D-alanine ligase [Oceanospirillales bacterium]